MAKWITKKVQNRIDEAKKILDESGDQMTLRHLFYLLISQKNPVIRANQKGYKNLGYALKIGRKAGLIDFEKIIDETRKPIKNSSWEDLNDYFETIKRAYTKDKQINQDEYLEVWIEKLALGSIIRPITNFYDIPLLIWVGYQSLTALYEAGERFKATEKPCRILYFGDLDPSGENMPEKIKQDLVEFFGVEDLELDVIALTPKIAKKYKLFPKPTKEGDTRRKKFEEKYGKDMAFELDALPSKIIKELVEKAIKKHLDIKQLAKDLKVEKEEKIVLEEFEF